MNFVESLSMFHVDAKEIPCVTEKGAPTEKTLGAPGVLYMDTDTGDLYKCRAADAVNEVYTWEKIGGANSEYKLPIGGEQLGGVKNGGNVTINADGTMTAPVSGSSQNVDLTGYAKEQWVQEGFQPKGDYLTAVPAGYATEEFVKNKIAEAELGGEEVDLSGYAQKSEIPTKVSQLENDAKYLTEHQDLSEYAKKTDIPSVPVQSVNGKTGAVNLSASDVGARPATWMPTAQEVGALPSTYTPPNQTAAQVGADPKGTAASAVSEHNVDTDAHNDLRTELKALSDRLTAFFDSDDTTLDELSEIVAYITRNKTLIDSITTSKVNVADIVNNLTTNVANKPLSAAQGVVLKGLIDSLNTSLSKYALASSVPTKVSQLENDKGFLTEHQDISGKLDASELPTAINTALAQAKASGEFNGNDGFSPAVTLEEFTEAGKTGVRINVVNKTTSQSTAVYNGTNGTSASATVTKENGVATITTRDASGIHTVEVKDGKDGEDGQDGSPGKDGTSPVVSVSAITGGHRITITDVNGTKTVDVMDGVDGSDGENAETVPDYVRTEAERVADNVLAVRNGKSFVFAASSDAHIGLNDVSAVSAEHAGMGMKCIREITNLDMIVHLGDYIEGASDSTKEASKAEYKKYHSLMYDACVGIPTVWEKGNHDANYQGVEAFSLDECFAYIGANNQGNHVVEYGNESRMYGYLDFESKRLRVIYLNSSDAEFKTGVSSEQATWLSTTAFDFSAKENPAEWGWIILIHIPVTFVDNARLLTAINAYSGEAEPIAIFHGHCHNFRTEQVSSLNIWQIGIPELCVGRNNEYATQADYSAIFGELDESGTPVYHNKETGNAKDTSFNVVTIDRKNHKIYAHVFGAGIDRILEYTGNVSYTNLFYSADADVKTASRISESSGIGSMDDSWVTGFIPAVSGDVIRVRFPNGKSVKYADGYTRAVISMHDSAKTLVPLASYYSNTESNVTVDADGLGYTATIGKDDTVYIRCAGYGDYAGAIITKNEQIV